MASVANSRTSASHSSSGRSDEPVADLVAQRLADADQVVAGIGAVREVDVAAVRLEVAQVDRPREHVDLRAAVVDVELTRDVIAREGEKRRQRVAEHRASGMADMQRPGGIGRDELDIDLEPRAQAGMTEAAAGIERLGHHVGPDLGREPEVEEAGPRHIDGRDARIATEPLGQFLADLAGVHVGGPGENHRGVRRHVAVGGIPRRLDRDRAVVESVRQLAVDDHDVKRLGHNGTNVGIEVHAGLSRSCAPDSRRVTAVVLLRLRCEARQADAASVPAIVLRAKEPGPNRSDTCATWTSNGGTAPSSCRSSAG